MQIIILYCLMMCSRVTLARVICKVLKTWMILKTKKFLYFSVQKPEISHFHTPRFLPLDGIIYNSHSCCIIYVDGRGGLWMSKFFEGQLHNFRFLSI